MPTLLNGEEHLMEKELDVGLLVLARGHRTAEEGHLVHILYLCSGQKGCAKSLFLPLADADEINPEEYSEIFEKIKERGDFESKRSEYHRRISHQRPPDA